MSKYGEPEKRIAQELLIELLAHQFAFPVRWIETQNYLFSKKDMITRFVELGPSKVLIGMAKRTYDSKYSDRDSAICVDRKFLASTQDQKELSYEYRSPEPTEADDTPQETPPESISRPQEPTPAHPVTVPISPLATLSIVDVPTTVIEIICAIVAHKLKRKVVQVSPARSIKDLAGGKSTLQNEIIGDLSVEFGSVPDAVEDMQLIAIADAVQQSTASSELGKHTSNLVAKLISTKMPAGFKIGLIRKYLSDNWGLGSSRQDSVLLFAICSEPPSRLATIEVAKGYLDSVTVEYAKNKDLILQSKKTGSENAHDITPVMDSTALTTISKDYQNLAAKQHKILSEYLRIDNSFSSELRDMECIIQQLQERLDLWSSEYDSNFESRIRPMFDVKKLRKYNSWWNHARQTLVRLFHNAENGSLNQHVDDLESICSQLLNGSDIRLVAVLKFFTSLSLRNSTPSIGFAPWGKKLLELIEPSLRRSPSGEVRFFETDRDSDQDCRGYLDVLKAGTLSGRQTRIPYAHVKTRQFGKWNLNQEITDKLFRSYDDALSRGLSFSGKTVLVTGAGPNSIGVEIIKGLLQGGAKVIVTTSKPISKASIFYRKIYEECASRDSELVVMPFNQGSVQDCEALIKYIYRRSGVDGHLDAVIPFAALPEQGIEIDEIASTSELAHRLMLLNVLRLLGQIVRSKKELRIDCCPTLVILPLSPNHGTFGGDGLYSESKLGLESLLDRSYSESWSGLLSICGMVIGWTRGTGLMNGNDIVAETVESHDVLTFSRQEMAFHIVSLVSSELSTLFDEEPMIVDVSGGLGLLENCKIILMQARAKISEDSEIAKAVHEADMQERELLGGGPPSPEISNITRRRSTLRIDFPSLPNFDMDLLPLNYLQGMVDLSTTVVVVGYSELGPWGNSRTRWEIEKNGVLTQEGYIEMAWMMNLIKHVDGNGKTGDYVGWVDSKTGDHVHDVEVEGLYGQHILNFSGIRFIDPEMFEGYDPEKKEYLQEIAVEEDLPEFETTRAVAEAFKLRHGDRVSIRQMDVPDSYKVQIKSGAHILVPKSVPFSAGLVAGQIPKGWNPLKYGIEEDIINQVDPVTLYTLCCVSEALYSAGIVDSIEIFKHMHLAELGNYIGSSMGGTAKTRQMYKDIFLERRVQGDVIQETYLNTPAAWVNMLLFGSTGPIKTPVGACATGVESIDIGFESIMSGKTKMCIVGGTDNFQEDESYGFSTMKATVNTAEEFACGRLPSEMSRPTSETRAGFLESQGCGIQIICSAELALEMGLPIYGIIASSTMAADKISRSVPAPGQGVLTFARETPQAIQSPLLDMDYRREQLNMCISKSSLWHEPNFQTHHSTNSDTPLSLDSEDSDFSAPASIDPITPAICVNQAAEARIKAARRLWGNEFRAQNPDISPLRASLATWGLTVDDISVASMHGTSTKANDKNEAEVIHKQMDHLGRAEGNPLLTVFQKSITGHPKAPAAAWMLNGCLQILNSGIVPGNRNADNVDEELRKFHHLVFPTQTIKTTGVKAFILTSFGFGQKGGQVVGVAPKYLFATLQRDDFEGYSAKVESRKKIANREFVKAIFSNSIFKAQADPPYQSEDESRVFLDPHARLSDTQDKILKFDPTNLHGSAERLQCEGCSKDQDYTSDTSSEKQSSLTIAAKISKSWIEQTLRHRSNAAFGIGIDTECVKLFTADNNVNFVTRNYTEGEQLFAAQSPDPHATFVSRWCAKEAVFKSLGTRSRGAGTPLKDIEIYSEDGIPKVMLHGDAKIAGEEKRVQDILLSLSYSDDSVIAVALALRESDVCTETK